MIFHVGVPSHLGPKINYRHITKINTIKNNHSYRTKNVELPRRSFRWQWGSSSHISLSPFWEDHQTVVVPYRTPYCTSLRVTRIWPTNRVPSDLSVPKALEPPTTILMVRNLSRLAKTVHSWYIVGEIFVKNMKFLFKIWNRWEFLLGAPVEPPTTLA